MTATLQELLDNANEEAKKWRKLYFDLKCDYLELHKAARIAKKEFEIRDRNHQISAAWQGLNATVGEGLLDPGKIQKVTLYP